MAWEETIVAPATPPGLGGVAVVRLSGPEAGAILEALVRPSGGGEWESHRLRHGWACSVQDGLPIDEVLAVLMVPPRSYTRELVAEIHCHGGDVISGWIVDQCLALGARLARPGEFTLRAFLNGRVALSQAEAVLGLVQATTRDASRLALAAVRGSLAGEVGGLRDRLVELLVELEAEIDFGEEVSPTPRDLLGLRLGGLVERLEALLRAVEEGRVRTHGLYTVLAGAPNAGKSSLWNQLLGEDRALVTEVPGTTRDRLEESWVHEGLLFRLVDTAGLRGDAGRVEALGIERTRQALAQADVRVILLDRGAGWPDRLTELVDAAGAGPSLVVLNKADQPALLGVDQVRARFPGCEVLEVSCLTGLGFQDLKRALVDTARRGLPGAEGGGLAGSARQRAALARAAQRLAEAWAGWEAGAPVDCVAGDVRLATLSLGEVTGHDLTEEVLDGIFSTFCLGK